MRRKPENTRRSRLWVEELEGRAQPASLHLSAALPVLDLAAVGRVAEPPGNGGPTTLPGDILRGNDQIPPGQLIRDLHVPDHVATPPGLADRLPVVPPATPPDLPGNPGRPPVVTPPGGTTPPVVTPPTPGPTQPPTGVTPGTPPIAPTPGTVTPAMPTPATPAPGTTTPPDPAAIDPATGQLPGQLPGAADTPGSFTADTADTAVLTTTFVVALPPAGRFVTFVGDNGAVFSAEPFSVVSESGTATGSEPAIITQSFFSFENGTSVEVEVAPMPREVDEAGRPADPAAPPVEVAPPPRAVEPTTAAPPAEAAPVAPEAAAGEEQAEVTLELATLAAEPEEAVADRNWMAAASAAILAGGLWAVRRYRRLRRALAAVAARA